MIHLPILKKVYSHDIDPDMVPESVNPESLIGVDNEVITMVPMITDDDILRSVTTNQQEQSDEDDDNNEEVEEAAPERPLKEWFTFNLVSIFFFQ